MGPRPVRKNGFQQPRSGDQLTAMTIYPPTTAAFYGLLIWLEYNNIATLMSILLPHLVLVVFLLCNWYVVETLDPEDSASPVDGKQKYPGIKMVCFDQSLITTRYCGTCRKRVYGLDHHCTWLNTCIGARNYAFFFALIVAGTFQMIYQSTFGLLYMTTWRESSSQIPNRGTNLLLFYCLIAIFCFVSALLAVAFGVLMGFHLYLLLWIRAGTYDWMMGAKRGHSERAWSRAKKQDLEMAHRQSQSPSSGTDVRHGYVTDTGDIKFKQIDKIGSDDDSLHSGSDIDHLSASGDDVSASSFVSSRTEELNDPDPDLELQKEFNRDIEEDIEVSVPPLCVLDEDLDHDPNVPTKCMVNLEMHSVTEHGAVGDTSESDIIAVDNPDGEEHLL